MKIIEALKKNKDLMRKLEDIRKKLSTYCADMSVETPTYDTPEKQREQMDSWLKSHHDILKEIEKNRLAIQRTNLATMVKIQIVDDLFVEKSIAAWIHRRKDLANLDFKAWTSLTCKNLRQQAFKPDPNKETIEVATVRKYYDQKEKDKKVEEYTSEPSRINAALEIVNATTDLI